MGLLVCRNFFESCSPAASRFPLNVFFFSLSFLFPLCSLSVWYPFSLFTKFNWNSIETKRNESKRNETTLVTIHTPPLSLSLCVSLRNGSICYRPHAMPHALSSLSLDYRRPILVDPRAGFSLSLSLIGPTHNTPRSFYLRLPCGCMCVYPMTCMRCDLHALDGISRR